MKRKITISKKTGKVTIEGLEQSTECHQLIDSANSLGNVTSSRELDHDDDAPVHDGVNVRN